MSVFTEIYELLSQSRPGDANNLYSTVKEDVTALGFKEESQDLIEIMDAYECDEASEKLVLLKTELNKLKG